MIWQRLNRLWDFSGLILFELMIFLVPPVRSWGSSLMVPWYYHKKFICDCLLSLSYSPLLRSVCLPLRMSWSSHSLSSFFIRSFGWIYRGGTGMSHTAHCRCYRSAWAVVAQSGDAVPCSSFSFAPRCTAVLCQSIWVSLGRKPRQVENSA